MKKICLFVFGLAALAFVGCGEKVSDPEALYQKYLKDDAVREAKMKECSLLSVDEQMKSQSCALAGKATGQKGIDKAKERYRSSKEGKKE